MSEYPTEHNHKIADLEAALQLPLPETVRQQLELTLAHLRAEGANLAVANSAARDLNQSTVNVGDGARIYGPAVGINLGKIIYGRDPLEDERRLLIWYLDALANKLYRLPFRGLEKRLDQGEGIALPRVYVTQITESYVSDTHGRTSALSRYYQDGKQGQVRVDSLNVPSFQKSIVPLETSRRNLISESLRQRQHLVILGDPGSGKSTFLRHLAWALAMRSLDQPDQEKTFIGWSDDYQLLPILLPLRSVARRLGHDGAQPATVYAILRDEIQSYNLTEVDSLLRGSLHRGAAILLLDGLDEVPIEVADGIADRLTTLQVIHSFAQLHPRARIIITCRSRAFADDLRSLLGWNVEMLVPFTLRQIRHFISAWYAELVITGQLSHEQAAQMEHALVATILMRSKLRAIAGTPLLLTMMVLLLYNQGMLPRDLPQLYERILDLLLGRWDQVRDARSLAEATGLPEIGSERIHALLGRLSYEAQKGAVSENGHRRLVRRDVRDELIAFFEAAQLPAPWSSAQRCLDYFEQRSGLLVPDSNDSYVFAYLPLQEHYAGRHIALGSDDPVTLVMRHRTDEHWREPIFLGMGMAHPAVLNSIMIELIDRDEAGQPKSTDRYYRDLVLAAEIGQDRDWNYLRTRPMIKVDRFQRDLRAGLVALLQEKNYPLPVSERVRAGFLLGDLGDPRYPITIEDWQREVDRALAGDANGYFCRVGPGSYLIGSVDGDYAKQEEKPQHIITFDAPFWIGRYPVVNIQWQAWVEQGGELSHYANAANLNHPNQPVVGVTWHMCAAFCTWLNAQTGAMIRLPTEYEWEAAARGSDARHYPWGDKWQGDCAATLEDQETRGQRYTVPIGCYSTGAAPCGALDMAGNVWEWTADEWRSYPGAQKVFADSDYRLLRGGGYGDSHTFARCEARDRGYSQVSRTDDGFRVVFSPASHDWPA
jgi:formylglycine-generating enzyme required for sulfatase activity